MTRRIEDYALIGDLRTAALVSKEGAIDWLCLPGFDSPACFASLVGDSDNGLWQIRPAEQIQRVTRRYRDDSLVLETLFETATGSVKLIDCMALSDAMSSRRSIVRLVVGESGNVPMRMELVLRFDYGRTVPWVHRRQFGLSALSGPNAVDLETPLELRGEDFRTRSSFVVRAGDRIPLVMTWRASTSPHAPAGDAEELILTTDLWWQDWVKFCDFDGPWRDAVARSLITLKALTDRATGGIVAAATTSLPEWVQSGRNWDYRSCWLRDATFTLYSLLISGLKEEAIQWRDWLLRVAAGRPEQLQTVYGVGGERILQEFPVPWLKGFDHSRPVRVGNRAHRQFQLDTYGEVLDMFHVARSVGIDETADSLAFQEALLNFLESGWRRMDSGIWEVRGRRRHFTHSKLMAWVGIDRATRAADVLRLPGSPAKWKRLADRIHADICRQAYNPQRKTFVQSYGSQEVDAALLLIPLVGFLPPTDPRVLGTLRAIENDLMQDGFVHRYRPSKDVEGLEGGEGAFLACSFWLVDNYTIMGRMDEARTLFERLLSVRNDVGLLAEEYDPASRQLLGNFPQAFSHVALVNSAQNLWPSGPAVLRARGVVLPPD
jgi:GH15 family glucan-1,4-alpha-glucosidase